MLEFNDIVSLTLDFIEVDENKYGCAKKITI